MDNDESASSSSKIKSFAAIGISPTLVRSLAALRIKIPTSIQNESIPIILQGKDLIGGSPTGSGKTLAFALPILESLKNDMVGGHAVVLTPTRELAMQLYEQFLAVSQGAQMGVRCALIVGGLDIIKQSIELEKNRPNIIIATPGRLVDIIQSGGNSEWGLERCKFLVLDEADRLLTSSFGSELAYLMTQLPSAKSRQTLLFTATLTPEIELLTQKEPEDGKEKPILCKIEQSTSTPKTLDQRYLFVPSHMREVYLYNLLLLDKFKKNNNSIDEDDLTSQVPFTIIFVGKSKTAALLSHMLEQLEIQNASLHSSLSQPQRLKSLDAFRSKKIPILITTDLGSRGLDIPNVELVINWDLPRDWRDYIHRVGRTARNGEKGLAISFIGERDIDLFKHIEKTLEIEMKEVQGLYEEIVLQSLNKVTSSKRLANMHLHDSEFDKRKKANAEKNSEDKKVSKINHKKNKSINKQRKPLEL